MIYDWLDDVVDIREQYPLDRDDTRRIAEAIGVRHPAETQTQTDIVMSTDLVVDFSTDGTAKTIARAVKHSQALEEPRTLEKLEIERRYWFENGVDFGIITERELPNEPVKTLRWLLGYRELNEEIPRDILIQIDQDLDRGSQLTFGEFCEQIDLQYGLSSGTGRRISNHFLAKKYGYSTFILS
nr:TnsA endonuclease N-terminal domain-containing protein [Mangrovicoccus algicola]